MGNRQGRATNGLEAVRTAWAVRSRRWWTRTPFLPVPDPAYMRWRAYTAYGDPDAVIVASDVAAFLAWRTGFRRYVRRIR